MGNSTSKEMKELQKEIRNQDKRVYKSEMRLELAVKSTKEKEAILNELRLDEKESKKSIEQLQTKLGEYGTQMQTLNLKIEEHKAETRKNVDICNAKVDECLVKTTAEILKSNARTEEFTAMAECFKHAMMRQLDGMRNGNNVREQPRGNRLPFSGIQARTSLERIQRQLQCYDGFNPGCRT